MKALLISTYELGHQPLGLASPLAHLRAAGVDARGLDLAVEPFDDDAVAEADFVGISAPMHTALRMGVRAAERVRRLNPNAHICFYGLYAGLNSDHLLRTCADSVIGGEIEEQLVRGVLGLAAGSTPEPAVTFLGRQQLLTPDRSGLPPLERYAHLAYQDSCRPAAAVETSRGCAHQCLHCPITPVYGGRLRIVPAEVVLADIRQCVALGAEHITFADPDFFNGIRHSFTVARAMHDEFPRLTFDATIKIEHLLEHRALLPELHGLGCLFITSAVESLSETVLCILDKGHTAGAVRTALDLTRAAVITLRPTFLPFTPWSTLDDYLELLDFLDEYDLLQQIEPVQLAIRLLVPPGSSLLPSSAMRPYLGCLDESALAYTWRHPDERMDVLAREVTALVQEPARASACPPIDSPSPEGKGLGVRSDKEQRDRSAQTFDAIRALARRTAGLPTDPPSPVGKGLGVRSSPSHAGKGLGDRSARPPGLTESWFC